MVSPIMVIEVILQSTFEFITIGLFVTLASALWWAFCEHREAQIEDTMLDDEADDEDEDADDEDDIMTPNTDSSLEVDFMEDTKTLYRTTVTYRNGDIEEFLSYGLYTHDDHHITLNNSVEAARTFRKGTPYVSFNRRKLSVYTLAREPEFEPVAKETWRLHYEAKDGYAQQTSLDLELVHAKRLDD